MQKDLQILKIKNFIMVLKIGSKGKEVKDLQDFLDLGIDGDFGRFVNAVSGIFSVWHGIEIHANRPFDLDYVAT